MPKKINIAGEHQCLFRMPKTKLSFAEITVLSGSVVYEVGEQCNNAAVPRGNIRFQGKLHTSCLIFSKSFSQKKEKSEVTHVLISSTGLPMSQFNFSLKIKNRKCNISSTSARDTFDEIQHCNIAVVTVGTNQNVIILSIKEPGSQRNVAGTHKNV